MQIFSVERDPPKLDGGTMFGNCPRAVCEKWAPPDEKSNSAFVSPGVLLTCVSGHPSGAAAKAAPEAAVAAHGKPEK